MRYGTTRLRALARIWQPSRANGTWESPPQLPLHRNAGATRKQLQRQRRPRRLEAHPRSVNRDMKLYLRLLGWMRIGFIVQCYRYHPLNIAFFGHHELVSYYEVRPTDSVATLSSRARTFEHFSHPLHLEDFSPALQTNIHEEGTHKIRPPNLDE